MKHYGKIKRKNPTGILLVLIVLILMIGVSAIWIKRYMPTKERADLLQVFDITDNEEAILLNNELQEWEAMIKDGQSYLPLEFVHSLLNQRFYWDPIEYKLIYTTPLQMIEILPDMVDEHGYKKLILEEDIVYLQIGLIEQYTNIRYQYYDTPQRIFIDTVWGTITQAQVKKDTQIRERGGVKSLIISDVYKDSTVTILEEMDSWTKVVTSDGYIGYIQNNKLDSAFTTTIISDFEEPVYENISRDYGISLGWHQVTNTAANANLEKVIAEAKGLNVIAPTWIYITDTSGNIESLSSRDYVDRAHELGLEVWALIENIKYKPSLYELLTPTANRTNLIDHIIADALASGVDGINLDIEEVKNDVASAYIQFIRELSIACRKNNLVFSIDNPVPTAYTAHYNRKEQGIVADYIVTMGYDEHYSGSSAGSVSSLTFTTEGLLNTLEEVAADKVIHAIPFYTRLWKEIDGKTTSEALGMRKAKNTLTERGIQPVWLEDIGQYYGEYDEEGAIYRIWLEDTASIELKMKIIADSKIAGVAYWKLGLEEPEVWEVINQYINP